MEGATVTLVLKLVMSHTYYSCHQLSTNHCGYKDDHVTLSVHVYGFLYSSDPRVTFTEIY